MDGNSFHGINGYSEGAGNVCGWLLDWHEYFEKQYRDGVNP